MKTGREKNPPETCKKKEKTGWLTCLGNQLI